MESAEHTNGDGTHDGPNRAERGRFDKDVRESAVLMLADIARSGLDAEDAKLHQFKPLTADEVLEITGYWRVPGYWKPYFNIDGTPLIDNGKPYGRIRLFHPEPAGFEMQKADLPKEKPPKYWQPKVTAPHLYLSPFIDWVRIARGNGPLMEVEGAKKAIAACKLGKACIGIGGVWAWKSKSTGQYELLREFDQFNLKDRDSKIIFDSDIRRNAQVLGALHAFARTLANRGSNPSTVILPDGPGGVKWGLDDLLVARGLDGLNELPSEKFNEIEALWQLNTEYAAILEPPAVYSVGTDTLQRHNVFTQYTVANRTVIQYNGKGEPIPASAGFIWIKWPNRRQYRGLAYEPGQPADLPDGTRNVWQGFKWESRPGDPGDWLYLMDHVFNNKPDAERIWFERWCAYPIQFPGTKMNCAAVFHGEMQGSGKTLIGLMLRGVYGVNSIEIDETTVRGSFNDWIARKQFVVCDEITNRKNMRLDTSKLKKLITQPDVYVNGKFQPTYVVNDHANFMFTSQHRDGIFVERFDRRFFIEEVTRKMSDEKRGYEMAERAKHKDMGWLRYYLENLSLGDFSHSASALETSDRADAIDAGRTDVDQWAQSLAADPYTFLKLGNAAYKPRDLYMIEELVSACKVALGGASVSQKALCNSLRRADINPTKTRISTQRGQVTLWVVNNADKWLSRSMSIEEIGDAYNASLPEGAKKQTF